ncbi:MULTISPECIES: c-type cytochrome [Sphingobacterium]|uniref:c-type cytochrome n=1 Tax=Sphingobacterium TaxID=28453 RepID=UPI0013DC04F2|nr:MULTISPECIES: c-type cytochrome [unclassified Sphingobacterium]
MKKLIYLFTICIIVYACSQSNNQNQNETSSNEVESENTSAATSSYDPKRGEGKYEKVEIEEKLDQKMATSGESIANLKCASCHKYSDEKLVGPGWAGVSKRHAPEWIMNFITNPDPMIDKDPKLQAQLELCLVRMPNQNLSDKDARDILEFMRKNDGLK